MNIIKAIFATIFGYLSVLYESHGTLFMLVIAAMVFDYITGVLAAAKQGTVNSKKASDGLYKKFGFFLLLCFGFFLDVSIAYFATNTLGISFSTDMSIGFILAAWIVLTEAISILENFITLDINVPSWIKNSLQSAKGNIENNTQFNDEVNGKSDSSER